jgi:hypothetical protein
MHTAADILAYLQCPPESPGIRPLNRLIRAYIRRVPWESVFRIAKSASTPIVPNARAGRTNSGTMQSNSAGRHLFRNQLRLFWLCNNWATLAPD